MSSGVREISVSSGVREISVSSGVKEISVLSMVWYLITILVNSQYPVV